MLIVVFFEPDMVRIERMMQHIADTFPEITSLLYIVNQKRKSMRGTRMENGEERDVI